MTSKWKPGKAWVIETARVVATELKRRSNETQLRIRVPSNAISVPTEGWRATIGDLGNGRPGLEIWFDRVAGYPDRKLYAGFSSPNRQPIIDITERVSRKLWPVREVGVEDLRTDAIAFAQRVKRDEFNMPMLEKYAEGNTFYGFFDPTVSTSGKLNTNFCNRAVSFFEDVALALQKQRRDERDAPERDIYPQVENRKRVVSHLHRERSSLLASNCKIRDEYICQVCGFDFNKVYGKLGFEFAEAHHLVPLSRLREDVKTKLEDLATVCGNCHRMLHRMKGEREDVAKLRNIVRKQRR